MFPQQKLQRSLSISRILYKNNIETYMRIGSMRVKQKAFHIKPKEGCNHY